MNQIKKERTANRMIEYCKTFEKELFTKFINLNNKPREVLVRAVLAKNLCKLGYTHQSIADMLGMQRPTITTTLKRWRTQYRDQVYFYNDEYIIELDNILKSFI